jgi:AAA domain
MRLLVSLFSHFVPPRIFEPVELVNVSVNGAGASWEGTTKRRPAPVGRALQPERLPLPARTFQGFQLRAERPDLLVIDEASMLSVPQMLWLVKHVRENDSRVLLVGDSAQHRSVERGDALRILEQSGSVRYVELLQTQRQKVPALKAAIEDLKAGRLENGWQKLEQHGVIKELTDAAELRKRAVEQHLAGLRGGKSSLMICPRHEEARKVAAVVRQQLKAEGAIGGQDHAVTVLRRRILAPNRTATSYTMRRAE